MYSLDTAPNNKYILVVAPSGMKHIDYEFITAKKVWNDVRNEFQWKDVRDDLLSETYQEPIGWCPLDLRMEQTDKLIKQTRDKDNQPLDIELVRARVADLEDALAEIAYGWIEEIHGELHTRYHDLETSREIAKDTLKMQQNT